MAGMLEYCPKIVKPFSNQNEWNIQNANKSYFGVENAKKILFKKCNAFDLGFCWFIRQNSIIIFGRNLEIHAIVRMASFERVAFASGGREHLS